MSDTSLLSSNITDSLDLGEHHYQDVRAIVEGKLRDRLNKIRNKKRRNGSIITEKNICDTIQYVMTELLQNSSIPLVVQTAEHYRRKYNLAI